ncbi:UDP-N-acetylglucosamine 1-carboxyvinyltransferase [Eubacteriales bacterium OttesenSCG-928-N14]|nr:UDP-N-acetylglucosamine 1-carboxyvinyltransferase [Eubacteriales bacterium OttesenSCG-928-N14]
MSDRLIIKGGKALHGEVAASGAKNAAVAILPAALLCPEPSTIDNLPDILDVRILRDILRLMGADVTYGNNTMHIDPSQITSHQAKFDLLRHMRASYYLLGALLGRFGEAEITLPGGCEIGQRPIDQHLKGMEALGAKVTMRGGIVHAVAPEGGLVGNEVYLDMVSVGATANIMMASVRAKGTTSIFNAAREPHIVDLANFLNTMGANIRGAGTDVIRVYGVEQLHGCNYTIIPDQIETGTLMIAAAATRGDVVITNVIPFHMESVSAKLMEMGVSITEYEDAIRVKADGRLRKVSVRTMPYPGFPTDLQQPLSALLATANGTSVIIENIFEDRYKHLNQLALMGAKTSVNGDVALIEGVEQLWGSDVTATDLRAGAALVIAGLMAQGTTYVRELRHIDRGYDHLEDKLISLGADISRVAFDDEDEVL